jgi:iron complex transport system permease protein
MILFSLAFLVVISVLALSVGRYSIPFETVLQFLASKLQLAPKVSPLNENILMNLRLPRVVAALIIGASLAVAGTAFQSVFQNPLVSPDILGVANGAAVGAAAAIILGFSSIGIQGAAFVMGLFAVTGSLLIQRIFKSQSTLILVLAGIVMSGFMQSVLGILKYIADPEEQLPTIVYWQLGSLAKVSWQALLPLLPMLFIALLLLFLLRWRLNLLSLSTSELYTLGSRYRLERSFILLLATLLTASSVCLSGTIGWLGLIIPHAARLLTGNNNARVVPFAAILGAVFLVAVDTLARTISVGEIPLSILTGLIGTPLFVWLIVRKRVKIG